MTNEVNLKLKLQTEGLNEANKTAEQLSNNMSKAAASSAKVGGSATMAAAKKASSAPGSGVQENIDYGIQRSVRGTGASARDFAQQAQSLGGLVHLYATYAANVYAVSAAFTALSKAMDVTNMVKGLDMLGAASGKNLSSTAKNLVAIADGAISAKEAMEATTKAATAGLDSSQIEKLAMVAKKASQALGRDMSDSFSRLSRGITKLEPELLDELGLFTKIGPATEAYARSVGKSTTALSDFERRQAFANAVLDEGMKKFSSIDMESNPFSRLQASATNLMQSGLELINKVLGPIVKLLSESPVALAGVFALIGTKLVSSAIPAISHWREGLRAGAEEAAKTAKVFKESFGDQFQDRLDKIFKIPELDKQLAQASKKISDFRKANSEPISGIDTVKGLSLGRLMDDPLGDKSKSDYAAVKKMLDNREKQLAKDLDGSKLLTAAKKAQLEAETTGLAKVIAEHEALLVLEKERLAIAKKHKEASDAQVNSVSGPIGALDPERIAEKRAMQLQGAATRANVVANAAQNASLVGVIGSWKLLNTEIEEKGIKGLSKYTTLAKGGLAAVGSRVMGIVSAFSGLGMVVGASIAAFSLFDSILSSNAKEMEATSLAFEKLRTTAELTDKVLEAISKKDPLAAFSAESITARANNLNEIASAAEDAFSKIKAAADTAGWWDSLINGIKASVGKDLISSSAREMAFSFSKAFKVASDRGDKEAASEAIKGILGVDPSDYTALVKAMNTSREEFLSKLPQAIAKLKELGLSQGIVASKASELGKAYEVAGKQMDTVMNSFMPSDNMAKLGLQFLSVGTAMTSAFEEPMTAVNELADTVGNLSKLRFFPKDTATSLVQNAKSIKDTALKVSELTSAMEALNRQEAENNSKLEEEVKWRQATSPGKTRETALMESTQSGSTHGQVAQATSQAKAFISAQLEAQKKALEPFMKDFKNAVKFSWQEGARLLEQSIAQGFAKAAITIQSAFVGSLSGTSGGVKLNTSLQNRQIDLEIQSINSTLGLIKAMDAVRIQMEIKNLRDSKDEIDKKVSKGELSVSVGSLKKADIDKLITAFESTKDRYTGRNSLGKLKSDLGSNDDNVAIAAKAAQPSVAQSTAAEAKKAELTASKTANKINEARELRKVEADDSKLLLGYSLSRIANQKVLNDLELQSAYFLGSETLAIKQQLDQQELLKKQEQERFDVIQKIKETESVLSDPNATGDTLKYAMDSAKALDAQARELSSKQAGDAEVFAANQLQARLADFKKEYEFGLMYAEKLHSASIALANSEFTVKEELLSNLATLGAISSEDLANEQTSLEILKEKMRSEQEIQSIRDKATRDLAEQSRIVLSLPDGSTQQANAQVMLDLSTRGYVQAIQSEQKLTASRQAGITALGAQKAELAAIASTTESLAVIFGELGNTVGSVAVAFSNMSTALQAQKKLITDNASKQADAKKIIDDETTSVEAKAKAKQELSDADAKSAQLTKAYTKLEIEGNARIAGNAKKLFTEKTFAYKALANVEKAMHIAKLAMAVKEMFVDTTKTASSVANAGTRAAADGTASIIKTLSSVPFPANVAAAAVVATIVASLIGGGKSIGSVPKGFTAEESQKVQGTGQAYGKDGKLVETGLGVYGDPTARTESIQKSLEAIKSTSVEGLSFSNEMVKLLTSIDNGINKAAGSLVNIPGLRSGSGFGTVEGSSGGKKLGWGGSSSTTIADSGVKLAGTLAQLAKGTENTIQQFENVITKSSSSSWFGLVSSNKTNTTTNTKDLGGSNSEVKNFFTQVFTDSISLMKELGKSFGITEDKVLGILDKLPINVQSSLKDLSGQAFTDALASMVNTVLDTATLSLFGNIVNKYKKIGETALQTVSRVVDANEKVGLALTSIGAKSLKDTIAAKAAVGAFTETVVDGFGGWFNLVPKFKKVQRDLTEVSVGITNALVESAGGLDKFLEQSKNFSSNFLTDAERLAPIQDAVTAKLSEMGLAGITTRKAFKDLVQSLDLTTDTDRKLYQSLMDLSSSFAMVYPAVEKSMTVEEYRSKLLQDQIDIEKALGNVYKSTLMQRQEELAQLALYPAEQSKQLIANKKTLYALQDAMSATNQYVNILKAQNKTVESTALQRKLELLGMDDRLRAGQEYIYAMQDESSLVDKLTKARDSEKSALQTTVDAISGYITTLRSYKNTLALGDNSILTSQQKYAQAKRELDRITAQAMMNPVTDADKKLQSEAINQLSGASDAFLALSKELNASSAQYTSDYSTVMQLLDSTTGMLDSQKTDAQMQLDALTASTAFLDAIATSTETVATLLPQYFAAVAATSSSLLAYQGSQATADAIAIAVTGALGTQMDTALSIGQALQDQGIATLLQEIAANTAVASGMATIMPVDTTNTASIASVPVNDTVTTMQTSIDRMTAQIVSLTTEVTQLRADAAAQTQAVIANNTVVNANVAQAVTAAAVSKAITGTWESRVVASRAALV